MRVATLAIAALVAACGNDASSRKDGAEVQTRTPGCADLTAELVAFASAEVEQVKLLTPGAEPRRALRYRPTLGARSSIVLRSESTMTAPAAEGGALDDAMPPMAITIISDIVEVRPDQTFVSRWVVDRAALEPKPGDDQDHDDLRRVLQALACHIVREHVDDRGYVRSAEVKDGPQVDLGGLRHVLPVEPVGVGATWEVVGSVDYGEDFATTTTYELVAADDAKVQLRATTKLTGDDSTGTQTADVAVDLATLTPTGTIDRTITSDSGLTLRMQNRVSAP